MSKQGKAQSPNGTTTMPPAQDDKQKAQEPQGEAPKPQVDPRIAELARKLGIADPSALVAVAAAFTEALTVEERNFETTRQAIVEAIGDYRGFTTITVANKDGVVTVERNVKSVKHNGTGNGTGGYQGHGQGIEVTLTGELQAKYHLGDATYKSRRQLAHAIAQATQKEPPADNAVPRWLKANAPDVWEHIGKPTS